MPDEKQLPAIENLENYLEKTPLNIVGGILNDDKALKKMKDALLEANKEYGFDKLIVDAHDYQKNPITLVVEIEPIYAVKIVKTDGRDEVRKAVLRYDFVPMKFGFPCNLDVLDQLLVGVEVKKDADELGHLRMGSTFFTKSAYLNHILFGQFMQKCTEPGAYGTKKKG